MLWLKWCLAQSLMWFAAALGTIVLIVPCRLRAWKPGARSIKDGRPIDEWKWSWLNFVYGNPEDGVSGSTALIWVNGVLSPYRPKSRPAVRAYLWSAFRNSCDNLKYKFAIPGEGPIKYWWKFKFGYQAENGYNVPVLGLK